MKTENIIEVFKEYLKDDTNYAILIDGSWGSGKTFFWKNELLKIVEDNNLKPLYISLNGISTVAELENSLFIKLIPFIDQNDAAFKFIKNVANGFANFFFRTKIDDVIKGISIDSVKLSKYVICFDDLERCQIPVKEVLGFINNFVEHKGLKTIVLADEDNIDRQSKSAQYDSIKEKVIGRVFKYEANIKEIFQLLINQETDKNFQKFIIQYLDYTQGLLIEFQIQNLRVVKYYLQCLKKMYKSIEKDNETYIKEVLLFSLCISCEFKNGNLKSSDYKDYKQLNTASIFFAKKFLGQDSSKLSEDNRQYIDVFYERYLSTRDNEFHFYPCIYKYILTGYLDEIEFKKEVSNRYPKVDSEEDMIFTSVFTHEFRELSEEEFESKSLKAIEYVKAGVYSMYDYIQVADFLYYFGKNGMTQLDGDAIDTLVNQGLSIAIQRKEIDAYRMENILHFPKDNPKVAELVKKVHDYHISIEREKLANNTEEFIEAIKSNNGDLLYAKFDEYTMSKDLFQFLDAELLFKTIVEISTGQLDKFTRALKRRYNSINIGKFLFEDYDCLNQLCDKIKHYIDEQVVKEPRKFLLRELSNELDHILYALKNPED